MYDLPRIGKARNARLNKARRQAGALVAKLADIVGIEATDPHTEAEFWEDIRELAAEISQCVHEANAYNNVITPAGTTFERDVFVVPSVANGTTSQD